MGIIRLLFSWIEKLPSSDKSKLAGAVIVKLHEAKRNLLLKREKFLFWGKFEGYLMDISWTRGGYNITVGLMSGFFTAVHGTVSIFYHFKEEFL